MNRITNHLKNPFAGLNQLLERANLTGFDTTGIVEARRKDIDAILEANRIVYAGAQALAEKQFEILRATMTAARSAVTDGTFSGSPMEIANRQRDLMAKAFQVSLQHMRELAEIVRKAQADAFAVVKGQVDHDIHDLVGRAKGKGQRGRTRQRPRPKTGAQGQGSRRPRRARRRRHAQDRSAKAGHAQGQGSAQGQGQRRDRRKAAA